MTVQVTWQDRHGHGHLVVVTGEKAIAARLDALCRDGRAAAVETVPGHHRIGQTWRGDDGWVWAYDSQ